MEAGLDLHRGTVRAFYDSVVGRAAQPRIDDEAPDLWLDRMDEHWELRGEVESPLLKKKPSEIVREALKIAEKLQRGGHANACGASLPKSVRTVQDAVGYLRNVLNPAPPQASALNSLEAIFSELEAKQG